MTDVAARVASDDDDDGGVLLEHHFLKSNFFRVIHVDGAYGGVSPDGSVQMVLYSERLPIPDLTVSEIQDDGRIKERRDLRVSRGGLVREVEVAATMNEATARNLLKWLQNKVDFLDKIKTSDFGDDADSV